MDEDERGRDLPPNDGHEKLLKLDVHRDTIWVDPVVVGLVRNGAWMHMN
jgi:hypothetical protein